MSREARRLREGPRRAPKKEERKVAVPVRPNGGIGRKGGPTRGLLPPDPDTVGE